MGWGIDFHCVIVGDSIMCVIDENKLDLVVLVHQLRLYVEKHGEKSFEGRYAELLIDMAVKEIEENSKK